MLKIKDEVDLKELEKFGVYIYANQCRRSGHFKVAKNRHIIPLNGGGYKRFDIIYDLIQAGLVEKVEE